ncbi:pentatricopeptide repeat-containing protein 2, mitochondrial, partial [Hyalella azteca]|uniref:Pentatricopeptide repeat-containing protein 2, mitochondrial n=1 Tax=Hyalella azteca TaxID=294128 RepID=A0A8B7N2Z8_HYAAZ
MLSFATNMRAMLTTSKLLKFGYWKQSDCNIMGKHYIFTKQALGIDKFLEKKNEIIKQSSEEETLRFQTKMRELLAQSGHKLMLVFKQDLEKAIYVCQDKEEDIQLVQHLACKYAKQNAKLRFGSFTFGAVLMRMCYVLNKPDVAMQWVESAELGGLFSHPSARQVLMCLLYEGGLHAQVLDVMDDLSTGRHSSVRHPRDCVVVALAAALKQGSEDSLSRGLALAQACHGTGWHSWRLYAIAGCVALKASRPDVALQLLTDTVPTTVTAVVNILMLAWCEVGRPDQA